MPDTAPNRSLTCTSCGAVWVTASAQTGMDGRFDGSDGSDGSDACLQCGGALLPADGTGIGEQET